MAKRQSELQRFAAIGALAHIEKLQAEIDRIRKAFPTLRRGGGITAAPASSESATSPAKARRKRKMSAAARKSISEAQKARWAKHRSEAAKKK